MGNIRTLKRSGMMEKADTTAHTSAAYDLINDLTFANDGNQIIKVTDAVDDGPYYQGAWHYRDNADEQEECIYDAIRLHSMSNDSACGAGSYLPCV